MRRSVIWSAALHLLVVALAVIGLPRLWDTGPATDAPVVVEVVRVDEKTTAEAPPKRELPVPEKPVEKAPPPEPPQAKPRTAEPPPSPKVAEAPEPKAEKVPVAPKPKPEKKAEKKKEEKPEAKKPVPPRTIAKARPRPKPLPPKEDFIQSVLRDVAPDERAPTPRKAPEKTPPAPQPQPEKPATRQAPVDAQVTTSEIDAIRHTIEQCWVVPAGARDAEGLVVSIRVWVNPDGRVREARILDQSRMYRDPYFRTAAESALRAVLNPRCSPLPIPPKKYDQFREIVLDFNPKDAAGS